MTDFLDHKGPYHISTWEKTPNQTKTQPNKELSLANKGHL